jgi:predicted transcriptional regulator
MSVTRRTVLEQLATASDAGTRETTTIEALAAELGTSERTIQIHLAGLEDCELARRDSDGRVRVTITGEELLELNTDEMVIVEPTGTPDGRK